MYSRPSESQHHGLRSFSQVLYLFTPLQESPLSVLFTAERADAIPLATTFSLLHIAVHFNLLLMSSCNHPQLSGLKPISYPITFVAAALAPFLAVMLRRSLADVAWWSFTMAIAILHHAVHRWIAQGEESIRGLEQLKYDAKGA